MSSGGVSNTRPTGSAVAVRRAPPPPESTRDEAVHLVPVQGNVYRILYVHVPLAWLAYLAFVVVFLASVGWLWTKNPLFDAIAVSSGESCSVSKKASAANSHASMRLT